MESAEQSGHRAHAFARRFLQTAVVVDDEAYMAESDGPESGIVAPDRRVTTSSREERSRTGRRLGHSLDARSVIDSFSSLGVICGVVGPTESAMEVMRKADIVVLDWLLQDDDPEKTLELLRNLVDEEEDRNSLRLVAIYTGDARLEDICSNINAALRDAGLDPEVGKFKTTIAYRHGRVVLYAKSDVNLADSLKDRSVAEEDLPGRLVEDFSAMTEGLLPRIALASLTAVREGTHKILDRFCADLDPAFLAQRVSISNPDDAESQIVNHVAEELRGLMDNAVAERSPAGAKAVESWIRCKSKESGCFKFGERKLDLKQTITLATKGLEASELKKSAFKGLSAGFSGDGIPDLDERLAWIMSFRTVFNAPPPTLWLGTVVTEVMDDEEKHLICMRPRCDCVRLEDETSFLFLPLVEPDKMKEQLVVRIGDEFKRLGIRFDLDSWIFRKFKPLENARGVTARKREDDGEFGFTDTCDECYTWRGELKAEYAQRIAQTLATTMSRVAVDESEWLRRMAGKGR